jgi:hypothetical protein
MSKGWRKGAVVREYEVEQGNRVLEDAAHWDVVEYVKDCQGRRRMSLALRAKEKRQHRKWEESRSTDCPCSTNAG